MKLLFRLFLFAILIGGGYELYYWSGPIYKSLSSLCFKTGAFESDTIKVAPKPSNSRVTTSSPRELLSTVTKIVDGDTIAIDTGAKVRYIGINSPESVDPRKLVECFGKEASKYNSNLVLNKKIRLVKDVSEKDSYGRLLRYVYLVDGTFVNEKLVRDGYAAVMTVPPNVKFSKLFAAAEREARQAESGLWSKCKRL